MKSIAYLVLGFALGLAVSAQAGTPFVISPTVEINGTEYFAAVPDLPATGKIIELHGKWFARVPLSPAQEKQARAVGAYAGDTWYQAQWYFGQLLRQGVITQDEYDYVIASLGFIDVQNATGDVSSMSVRDYQQRVAAGEELTVVDPFPVIRQGFYLGVDTDKTGTLVED